MHDAYIHSNYYVVFNGTLVFCCACKKNITAVGAVICTYSSLLLVHTVITNNIFLFQGFCFRSEKNYPSKYVILCFFLLGDAHMYV